MFQRKIYDTLIEWKNTPNKNTALLISGARCVGKTYIVEQFAKNEYESYLLIDFEYASKYIQNLFKDITNLEEFFIQLQKEYDIQLVNRKSLIIFENIQYNANARQAMKALVNDGRYDYIETTCITSNTNKEDCLLNIELKPMDFEEFLWAIGDKQLPDLLKMAYENKIRIGDAQNKNMMNKFHLYMLIGGMPQVVSTYIKDNNLEEVDKIKRKILSLYMNEFNKIDKNKKILSLYKGIPNELQKHGSTYQISSVLVNERKNTVQDEINELITSNTVIPTYNVIDPTSMKVSDKFKLYVNDTGLLVTLIEMNQGIKDLMLYKKVLYGKNDKDIRVLYENVVAQMLYAKGNKLFYHTFYNEVQKRNYRIDFLLFEANKKFTVMNVNYSNYKTCKAMDLFVERYKNQIKREVLVYTKDIDYYNNVQCIPLYMIPWME